VTFLVHLIVAVIFGLGLLIIPFTLGGWLGYPEAPDLAPIVRAFGAMILGFGGLTSLYGLMAKSWGRVAYIVHGEITYLAIQTLVFAVSAIAGNGPAMGNWINAVVSAVLVVLFALTFISRPK